MAVLGAAKPEASTHLLIDLPEFTVPGTVSARIGSQLPATAALVLLRGAAGTPPGAAAAPVLVAAIVLRAGQQPTMTVKLDIERTETYTLLAFAQGRWVVSAREVKVGRSSRDARR